MIILRMLGGKVDRSWLAISEGIEDVRFCFEKALFLVHVCYYLAGLLYYVGVLLAIVLGLFFPRLHLAYIYTDL